MLPSNRSARPVLLTLCLLLSLALAVPSSASPLRTPTAVDRAAVAAAPVKVAPALKPITRLLNKYQPLLGKPATKKLRAPVLAASRQLKAGKVCPALAKVGRFVDATKRVTAVRKLVAVRALGKAGRAAQKKLLRRSGAKACGTVTVKVRPKVRPAIAALPGEAGVAGGKPRPLTSVKGTYAQTVFVENELIVSARSKAQLAGLLKRTGGRIVETASARGADATATARPSWSACPRPRAHG